jgi:hypothetical protein
MRDIDSGFKLIRKKVIDNTLNQITSFKYCVMSEFILRAYFAGYKIKEIPVKHYPRESGKTVIFSPVKLPVIVIGLMRSLFQLKLARLKKQNK